MIQYGALLVVTNYAGLSPMEQATMDPRKKNPTVAMLGAINIITRAMTAHAIPANLMAKAIMVIPDMDTSFLRASLRIVMIDMDRFLDFLRRFD